ncbi:DUF411 domain-containing protein [Hydrogenophaga taeniospiralis]|nr:DUF411 domain-containing protein [Hydrogenophaga taeniospiralis]UCU93443.1 DUF411 domain-containing protein [Hydrogenophaga taeniospiralis]
MMRNTFLTRRALVISALFLPLAKTQAANTPSLVEVWKTSSCGCCHNWVAHLNANGFEVKTNDISESAKAAKRLGLGMPLKFASCHTAVIQGYVLEGHVPASEIRRLLSERPLALGLAVPGMPIGSPGMDGPAYGGRKDAYAVLLVQREGTSTVFQDHRR